jgi:hypothetical protein
MSGTNTLAYWAHFNLRMGSKSSSVTLHQPEKACQGQTLWLIGPISTYEWDQQAGALYFTKMERLLGIKHPSLLGTF